ncbi:mitochondrial carrier [Ascodesmis nigricans]|uniref:Mitochondrial carrier n=1 Tax=Ascodesmis nigricans TaxID=341454 RepID=A0A4S2N842_9PEZI|nr:mitochondrial carrier [Ascodesmis nigricans]
MSTADILAAGAAAAFTVDLLIYPLDTLKTRWQSPSLEHRSIPRFKGLYQGVGSVVIATLPAAGAFFTVYETVRFHLPSHPLSNALASSIGELTSCAILTPAEVIKQRAQVIDSKTNRISPIPSSVRAFQNIKFYRHLWTGYTALAARNMPFTALQFMMFERLKKRWLPDKSAGVASTIGWAGLAAGLSGTVAAVVTTPVDVVKTRIMLRADERLRARDVVKDVLATEGFKGLFRGGTFRGAWTMVGSGLYLGVYEGAKLWLKERRKRKESQAETDGL